MGTDQPPEKTLQLKYSPVLYIFGLAGLYYAACLFSSLALSNQGAIPLFWPAAGVGLAGVVLFGPRHAWFVPLAILIWHATFTHAPSTLVVYSVLGNTLGVLVGGWLAMPLASRYTIGLDRALLLLLCGALLAVIHAGIEIVGLRHVGMLGSGQMATGFLRLFLGDLLGVIAISPALMLLPTRPTPAANPYKGYGNEPERLIWLVLLVTSYLLMAWCTSIGSHYALGVTALPLVMLTWCAMRFPPWWTARSIAFTCCLVGSFAGVGLAGFSAPDTTLDTVLLLLFLSLLTALPMALAMVAHEGRVATHRLLKIATLDPITGLNNRTEFERLLRQLLVKPEAPPRALIYLDLDHLKLINDTASHAAGDAVIRGVADVLQANMQSGDMVGHFGGDEFGILLHNCLPAAAEDRARQILRLIERYRCDWQGRMLEVTASIGLVPFQGEEDFARLLSQADAACFSAKEIGGNQVCRAALDGGERLDHTQGMRWALRVREAIDGNGLELHAQDITPLHGNSHGHHFELLLRVRDPVTNELMLPAQFFPAADRYRLGVRIDREITRIALAWLERNADKIDIDTCCINLSAQALVDEDFIAFLDERLRSTRFPPQKLCFEITETSALRDIPRAQRFISHMRRLGCRFSLDDFGTGFCSFSYLRSLDVDYFKIDGSFVRDMHDSPLSLQVVRAITDIAHVLGKQCIAEHAETPEQLALLTELGVDMAQGFAVHRPQPIDDYFASKSPRLVVAPFGPQTVA